MVPVSLLAIITASFFFLAALPGDIPHAILGQIATPEAIAQLKARLGLDQSVFVRYYHYVGGLLHGSLGESYYTGDSVLSEIGSRLPSTLELVIPGLVLPSCSGWTRRGRRLYDRRAPDKATRACHGRPIGPGLSPALILILSSSRRALAAQGPEGQLSFADTPPPHVTGMYVVDALLAGDFSLAASAARHLVLPVVTLGIVYSAAFGRTTRALMGRALNSEYTHFGGLRPFGAPARMERLLAARTSLLTYAAVLAAGIIGADADHRDRLRLERRRSVGGPGNAPARPTRGGGIRRRRRHDHGRYLPAPRPDLVDSSTHESDSMSVTTIKPHRFRTPDGWCPESTSALA